MASPRPVPPYFFAVSAEACENGVKRLAFCSFMPMPVSFTVNVMTAVVVVLLATRSETVPFSVNF
jgi:hypothetical protein